MYNTKTGCNCWRLLQDNPVTESSWYCKKWKAQHQTEKNGEVRAANVRRKWAQLHRHFVHRARPRTKKSKAALRTATPIRSSTKKLQLISSWLPKKRSKKQQKCNCFVYFYFFIFGGAQWGVRYRQQMRREHGHNYQNDWVHSGKKGQTFFLLLLWTATVPDKKKKQMMRTVTMSCVWNDPQIIVSAWMFGFHLFQIVCYPENFPLATVTSGTFLLAWKYCCRSSNMSQIRDVLCTPVRRIHPYFQCAPREIRKALFQWGGL